MARELAERAKDAVAQQAQAPTTIEGMLEQLKPDIAKVLPEHMKPERLARMALTVFRQNKALRECDPMSFLGALMTCSQLGLEPGPLGEAWFVPFKGQVTFIPGYRGLIKLAWQSGQMQSIAAHVVYSNDEFDFEYGLTPFLRHKPNMVGERGTVEAVYAAATFKDGGNAFVVMSQADVEAIRKTSASGQRSDSPWVKHWAAMARKTAIRQLIRYLPLSTELQNLARASSLDESVRTDVKSTLEDASVGYIQGETVTTAQGAVDPSTGEVLDGQIEDPPDVPDGW